MALYFTLVNTEVTGLSVVNTSLTSVSLSWNPVPQVINTTYIYEVAILAESKSSSCSNPLSTIIGSIQGYTSYMNVTVTNADVQPLRVGNCYAIGIRVYTSQLPSRPGEWSIVLANIG